MKIIRIKWHATHPILKGLELKLTRDDGTPYDTIILAADNGLGKTTILQTIFDFFDGASCEFEEFEYIEDGKKYVARKKDEQTFEVSEDGGEYKKVHFNNLRNNPASTFDWGYIDEPSVHPQAKEAKYSKAETDFHNIKPNEVEEDDDDENQHTSVKNLLITLERQDNEEFRSLNRIAEETNQPFIKPSEFNANHSRIVKFKRAYNVVFETLRFVGVNSLQNTTEVIFTKNNNERIELSQLSTGEKQIIYRGTQLLEGQNNDTVVALVDEPELSMHPRWQAKILTFYTNLFTTEEGQQKCQLIMATHSEMIVKAALEPVNTNTLVIRLTQTNGQLYANKTDEGVLPTLTAAETNYLAFGIYSVDYHIQLYGLVTENLGNHRGTHISILGTDNSIRLQPEYLADPTLSKTYSFNDRGNISTYQTLPTYIRNCIDHPGSIDPNTQTVHSYSDTEIARSIEFLRKLIRNQINGTYTY